MYLFVPLFVCLLVYGFYFKCFCKNITHFQEFLFFYCILLESDQQCLLTMSKGVFRQSDLIVFSQRKFKIFHFCSNSNFSCFFFLTLKWVQKFIFSFLLSRSTVIYSYHKYCFSDWMAVISQEEAVQHCPLFSTSSSLVSESWT